MKYLIWGLVLLALVLSCALLASAALDRQVERTVQQVDCARLAAERGDFNAALLAADCAAESWQSGLGLLGVLLNHTETDEVQFSFAALRACIAMEQEDEILPRCQELSERLKHIANMEKPFFYNIF